ncbi:proton channel OtopLc-like [Branchiostoma lanceolatum]|uniref:proton channel OtopLc-like n=1 Tax=Branchiostoma lanceolatum TaxID=7740 RepID=UPI003456CD70
MGDKVYPVVMSEPERLRRPSVVGTGRMDHVTYYALGFCGLYGMLLVVVGTVLPISEFISEHLVRPRVDGFFCYLYGMGFAWLVAVFVSGCEHGRCPVEDKKDDLSIFLKCGLVGFGLVSVIKAALEVAIYAEYNTMPGCYHVEMTSLLSPVGWIFFCLMQMYILLTFEMKKQPHGWQSWFYVLGLMHCVATNLCVWVNTVVHETVEALEHRLNQTLVAEEGHERMLHVSHGANDSGADEVDLDHLCQPVFLQHLMKYMSPMMYPCTIEESLIAAAAFAIAIADIKEQACGKTPTRQWKVLSDTSHYCMSSCKGLVAGVIVLATVLTTIIIYGFSFGAMDHWVASIAYQLTIFMCNIIGIIVTVPAWYYLRSHRSEQHSGAVLDKALLSVALFGVFLLAVLSLISGIMAKHVNWSDMLLTWRMGSTIVETSLQTVFIFDGLNRTSELKEKKSEAVEAGAVSFPTPGEATRTTKAVETGLVSFSTPGEANGEVIHDVVPLRGVLPVRQGIVTAQPGRIEGPTIMEDYDAPEDHYSVSCGPCVKVPFPLPNSDDRRASKVKWFDGEDQKNVGVGKNGVFRQKSAPERRRIRKRSRQLVMFLFVLNVTLWLVSVSNLYIPDTLKVQEQFYHNVAWILLTHIALPLLIFYRFHSAACLFEIWNHAYHPHQAM